MKLSKSKLKQIIKEEINNLEEWAPSPEGSMDNLHQGDVFIALTDHWVDQGGGMGADGIKINRGEHWTVAKDPTTKFAKIVIKKGEKKGRIAGFLARTATDNREYWGKA